MKENLFPTCTFAMHYIDHIKQYYLAVEPGYHLHTHTSRYEPILM